MKKRYQIEQQRAVQQFRRLATEENPNIQMILPMADIVGLLQQGIGHLLRQTGLELMNLLMDEEVRLSFANNPSALNITLRRAHNDDEDRRVARFRRSRHAS